jgi:hypothetical protein
MPIEDLGLNGVKTTLFKLLRPSSFTLCHHLPVNRSISNLNLLLLIAIPLCVVVVRISSSFSLSNNIYIPLLLLPYLP